MQLAKRGKSQRGSFEHLPDKNRSHSLCHALKHAGNALHTYRIHFLPISNQQLKKRQSMQFCKHHASNSE